MYSIVINNGLNPETVIPCKSAEDCIERYFQACFACGYDKVKIIKQ